MGFEKCASVGSEWGCNFIARDVPKSGAKNILKYFVVLFFSGIFWVKTERLGWAFDCVFIGASWKFNWRWTWRWSWRWSWWIFVVFGIEPYSHTLTYLTLTDLIFEKYGVLWYVLFFQTKQLAVLWFFLNLCNLEQLVQLEQSEQFLAIFQSLQ